MFAPQRQTSSLGERSFHKRELLGSIPRFGTAQSAKGRPMRSERKNLGSSPSSATTFVRLFIRRGRTMGDEPIRDLAQLAERAIWDRQVQGSTPWFPTKEQNEEVT